MKHARFYWLLLAESYLTRHLFESMVRRIKLPPTPTGQLSCRRRQKSSTDKARGKYFPECAKEIASGSQWA